MAETVEKESDNEIKVIIDDPKPPLKEKVYDYGFLKGQKANIERDIANMQLELDKVNFYISEADKLGVVEKGK